MILNKFEESLVSNSKLPSSWQSQMSLNELEEFLQQNWEQRSVFYEDKEVNSKQQFLGFVGQQGIRTKKYIGTIVFKGEQLNIFPKMFKVSDDDFDTDNLDLKHLMHNLIKWIEYCNRIAYPFINISTELKETDDLKELFITLYLGYIKTVLERGGFYQYVEETNDIKTIKGKFDFEDYVTRKLPNGQNDKFCCTYSNFEYDNKVNRIIKYTCKMLINMTSSNNQNTIRHILIRLNDVTDITCVPSDCDGIRLSKMQSLYKTIISMSKMFLLNKMSSFSMDTHDSFCFLFPTDLLFEGFIGGYMQEVLEPFGARVKTQQSDMHLIDDIQFEGKSLGAAFTMRHDIVVELNNKVFILDTKYKQISRFEGDDENVKTVVSEEPKQSDIYQVCEYARKRNVSDVYLLYPMFRYEPKEPNFPIGISKGASGDIYVHFIRLPFIFENDSSVLTILREIIQNIFDVD